MAFKMKNPSMAKMAKMAGSSRAAMKMKAESAMKHANRFGEYHTTERFPGSGPSPGKASDELGHVRHTHKSKTDGTVVTTRRSVKQKERDEEKAANSPAKKYASDAQRKAVHASKAESGMKMKHKSPAKKGHTDPKEGSHTTHGNPSKYTTASGKSVDSANIDEGNLSTVKKDSNGRKFVTVQDDTEKFKAGTKLYIK